MSDTRVIYSPVVLPANLPRATTSGTTGGAPVDPTARPYFVYYTVPVPAADTSANDGADVGGQQSEAPPPEEPPVVESAEEAAQRELDENARYEATEMEWHLRGALTSAMGDWFPEALYSTVASRGVSFIAQEEEVEPPKYLPASGATLSSAPRDVAPSSADASPDKVDAPQVDAPQDDAPLDHDGEEAVRDADDDRGIASGDDEDASPRAEGEGDHREGQDGQPQQRRRRENPYLGRVFQQTARQMEGARRAWKKISTTACLCMVPSVLAPVHAELRPRQLIAPTPSASAAAAAAASAPAPTPTAFATRAAAEEDWYKRLQQAMFRSVSSDIQSAPIRRVVEESWAPMLATQAPPSDPHAADAAAGAAAVALTLPADGTEVELPIRGHRVSISQSDNTPSHRISLTASPGAAPLRTGEKTKKSKGDGATANGGAGASNEPAGPPKRDATVELSTVPVVVTITLLYLRDVNGTAFRGSAVYKTACELLRMAKRVASSIGAVAIRSVYSAELRLALHDCGFLERESSSHCTWLRRAMADAHGPRRVMLAAGGAVPLTVCPLVGAPNVPSPAAVATSAGGSDAAPTETMRAASYQAAAREVQNFLTAVQRMLFSDHVRVGAACGRIFVSAAPKPPPPQNAQLTTQIALAATGAKGDKVLSASKKKTASPATASASADSGAVAAPAAATGRARGAPPVPDVEALARAATCGCGRTTSGPHPVDCPRSAAFHRRVWLTAAVPTLPPRCDPESAINALVAHAKWKTLSRALLDDLVALHRRTFRAGARGTSARPATSKPAGRRRPRDASSSSSASLASTAPARSGRGRGGRVPAVSKRRGGDAAADSSESEAAGAASGSSTKGSKKKQATKPVVAEGGNSVPTAPSPAVATTSGRKNGAQTPQSYPLPKGVEYFHRGRPSMLSSWPAFVVPYPVDEDITAGAAAAFPDFVSAGPVIETAAAAAAAAAAAPPADAAAAASVVEINAEPVVSDDGVSRDAPLTVDTPMVPTAPMSTASGSEPPTCALSPIGVEAEATGASAAPLSAPPFPRVPAGVPASLRGRDAPAAATEGEPTALVALRFARPQDRRAWTSLVLEACEGNFGGSEMSEIAWGSAFRFIAVVVRSGRVPPLPPRAPPPPPPPAGGGNAPAAACSVSVSPDSAAPPPPPPPFAHAASEVAHEEVLSQTPSGESPALQHHAAPDDDACPSDPLSPAEAGPSSTATVAAPTTAKRPAGRLPGAGRARDLSNLTAASFLTKRQAHLEAGRIVGAISLTESGWVSFLVVAPALRGHNLGTLLLAVAMEWQRHMCLWNTRLMLHLRDHAHGADSPGSAGGASSHATPRPGGMAIARRTPAAAAATSSSDDAEVGAVGQLSEAVRAGDAAAAVVSGEVSTVASRAGDDDYALLRQQLAAEADHRGAARNAAATPTAPPTEAGPAAALSASAASPCGTGVSSTATQKSQVRHFNATSSPILAALLSDGARKTVVARIAPHITARAVDATQVVELRLSPLTHRNVGYYERLYFHHEQRYVKSTPIDRQDLVMARAAFADEPQLPPGWSLHRLRLLSPRVQAFFEHRESIFASESSSSDDDVGVHRRARRRARRGPEAVEPRETGATVARREPKSAAGTSNDTATSRPNPTPATCPVNLIFVNPRFFQRFSYAPYPDVLWHALPPLAALIPASAAAADGATILASSAPTDDPKSNSRRKGTGGRGSGAAAAGGRGRTLTAAYGAVYGAWFENTARLLSLPLFCRPELDAVTAPTADDGTAVTLIAGGRGSGGSVRGGGRGGGRGGRCNLGQQFSAQLGVLCAEFHLALQNPYGAAMHCPCCFPDV